MRVPPPLFLRFALALAIVALAVAALITAESGGPPTTVASEPPPPPTLTLPPAPSATPRPTQTPQAITSIIVRQTLAPYPTSTPPPSNQSAVSIVDFSYMPGTVRIQAGQPVMWRNDGTEQHDVTGSDWHSGPLDPTYTYHLTFGLPGTYTYRCSIHLDMTGSVIVT